jgi:hypothetical protein
MCELLEPDDYRWTEFLDKVGSFDIYHEPAYASVCGNFEGGDPRAIWYRDPETGTECLLPLLFKHLPSKLIHSRHQLLDPKDKNYDLGSFYDASSPYGFSGPLMYRQGVCGALEEARIWKTFQLKVKKLLFDKNVVSLFVRLHPNLNLLNSFPVAYGFLSEPSQTVYVDLTQSLEAIRGQIAKSHRASIRKLRQMGFRTVVNDFGLLVDFVRMYHDTMARVDANVSYYFGLPYFESLREVFADRFNLILVLSPEGLLAAGGVFLECGEFVQFHLAATANDFRSLAPGKLTADDGFEFFKNRGRGVFNFGGGVGGQKDSLFEYKSRFSPLRGNFQVWKAIINEDVYRHMSGIDVIDSPDLYEGFFPYYRRSLAKEEQESGSVH